MATLAPLTPNTPAGIPGKSKAAITQTAAQTLTSSYVASDSVPCQDFSVVEVWLQWVEGDATDISVKVQTSPDDSTWGTRPIVLTAAAGGVAAADPHMLLFTAGNWDDDVALGPIFTHGARFVRLLSLSSDGTTSTIQPIWMGGHG